MLNLMVKYIIAVDFLLLSRILSVGILHLSILFLFTLQSSSLPGEGAHTEEASHSENGTKTDSQEGTIVGEGTAAGHACVSSHFVQPPVEKRQSLVCFPPLTCVDFLRRND